MSTTNLPSIQQDMIRYGMSVYLVLGIAGNICNCIVFTRYTYRRRASSNYFLALSILAIIYLNWSLAPIFYTLNYPDLQTQSLFYCKIRLYINHVLGQCLRYVVVFACIDRFFFTRTDIRIRSLTSSQMAIRFIFMICLIWLVTSIHIPILMNIRNGVCAMFGLYRLIYAIYIITFGGIMPPVLMCIFSTLTIRSLHLRRATQIRTRQRDRYLMRMVIAEVIVNIITSIPYSINLVYGAATYYVADKSAERVEIETFITFFCQFLIYMISVAPFYLFILTSKPFRNEFIHICIMCWDKYLVRRTRIVPSNNQNIISTRNHRIIHSKQ